MMAYTKQSWQDYDKTKPVSAARMAYIEDGIEAAHDAIAALPSGGGGGSSPGGTGFVGRFDVTSDTPIPDHAFPGVDIPIEVTDTGKVGTVRVLLWIQHTYPGDLTITLKSPAGTSHVLTYGVGGNGDSWGSGYADDQRTVFSDDGESAIDNASPAPTGVFLGPYLAVDGKITDAFGDQDVSGTWILNVYDGYSSDTGTVKAVSLDFVGAPPRPGHIIWNEGSGGPGPMPQRKKVAFVGPTWFIQHQDDPQNGITRVLFNPDPHYAEALLTIDTTNWTPATDTYGDFGRPRVSRSADVVRLTGAVKPKVTATGGVILLGAYLNGIYWPKRLSHIPLVDWGISAPGGSTGAKIYIAEVTADTGMILIVGDVTADSSFLILDGITWQAA